MSVDDFLVIDCFRIIDPNDHTGVYNDYFLKISNCLDEKTVGAKFN